jgi:hypothetical protein
MLTKTIKLSNDLEFTLTALTAAEVLEINAKLKDAAGDATSQTIASAFGVVMSINKAAGGGSMTVNDLLGKVTMGGLMDLMNTLAGLNNLTTQKAEPGATRWFSGLTDANPDRTRTN